MMRATLLETKAKPFLKWAGGKGQLLAEIDKRLPTELRDGQIDKYVEPFVGGGAVFFHVAQKYRDIKQFYLFDINPNLIVCYNSIKNNIDQVIRELSFLQREYHRKRTKRKDLFYQIRTEFNADRSPAKLIFLNKTCYNGLYRVNKAGLFNVPFGDYKNPTICNKSNLLRVSSILKNAEITCNDFGKSRKYINKKEFNIQRIKAIRAINCKASGRGQINELLITNY
jgi:DNA adenine methylase